MNSFRLKNFLNSVNKKYYRLFPPLILGFVLTFDKNPAGWLFLFLLIAISINKFIEIISFK